MIFVLILGLAFILYGLYGIYKQKIYGISSYSRISKDTKGWATLTGLIYISIGAFGILSSFNVINIFNRISISTIHLIFDIPIVIIAILLGLFGLINSKS